RTVSVWITSHLLGALDEAEGFPTLRGGTRTTRTNLDDVVRLVGFLLVVRVEALPALHVLAVEGIAHAARHLDDDRLLHATRLRRVVDDAPGELALTAAL